MRNLEEGYVNEERPPILSLVEAMDLEPDDQNFITQPPFFLKPLKERKLSSSVRDNQKMILSENDSKKADYPASKRKSITIDHLTVKGF
ncbi:hypothetical protein CEXT_759551 [Caerostris extrusa]|uniref:Uncharacterized protein n=1 Tax=Caerostris extrusa TaxID=172846 RepID=A0AAV4N060_CAEEX|nr:hypothetical protein CEXT_759551 [Caerostris extrusa]